MPSKKTPSPKWEDTTSYSQGRKRDPNCWTLDLGPFRIVVVAHRDYGGEYIYKTYGSLTLSDERLLTHDPEEARQKALAHVQTVLEDLAQAASVKLKEPSGRKAKAIACGIATAKTVMQDYLQMPDNFPKGPRCAVASLARAQLCLQHTYTTAVTEEEKTLASQAAEKEVDRLLAEEQY
jgi:hypothetical protein